MISNLEAYIPASTRGNRAVAKYKSSKHQHYCIVQRQYLAQHSTPTLIIATPMDSPGAAAEELDVVRHEQYYFSMVTLRVENCLFKLPRHFFKKSDVFQGMYAVAQADTDEGTCDQNPIYLADTKREDFESFLRVAVPPSPEDTQTVLSLQEWQAVLKLADRWNFETIRRIAIEEIDKHPMDEVEKVVVIQTYDVKEWACETFGKLAIREWSLTIDEMKVLGLEFSSKMVAAREQLMMKMCLLFASNPYGWSCSACHSYHVPCSALRCSCGGLNPRAVPSQSAIRDLIFEVFGDPIAILLRC